MRVTPPEQLDDAALVERALRGDRDSEGAQQALYRRYHAAIRRLARSFAELDDDEAEDVVQESFVRAFGALGSLKEPPRFGPWLFTIARNRARSALARRQVSHRAEEDAGREAEYLAEVEPDQGQVDRDQEIAIVREVIAELPDGAEKETVRLFYMEGKLTAREIALRMGVGKSAVTMRLERFRAKIKRRLLARLTRGGGGS
jgi:RNA polymerase sigma-70 factor (ECF subfamily)